MRYTQKDRHTQSQLTHEAHHKIGPSHSGNIDFKDKIRVVQTNTHPIVLSNQSMPVGK